MTACIAHTSTQGQLCTCHIMSPRSLESSPVPWSSPWYSTPPFLSLFPFKAGYWQLASHMIRCFSFIFTYPTDISAFHFKQLHMFLVLCWVTKSEWPVTPKLPYLLFPYSFSSIPHFLQSSDISQMGMPLFIGSEQMKFLCGILVH